MHITLHSYKVYFTAAWISLLCNVQMNVLQNTMMLSSLLWGFLFEQPAVCTLDLLFCGLSHIDLSTREVMSYLCWRLARSRLLFPAVAGWMYSCRHELTNILYVMIFIYWTDITRCRDSPWTSKSSDGKTEGIWCSGVLILQCCWAVF